MSHLTLEELARIVDDAPTPHEAEHLAGCQTCRMELDGMREDVQALALLPDVEPAPDSWNAIETRLLEEGLIRRSRFAAVPPYARMAAAAVLFLAGTLAGRITADTAPVTTALVPDPVPGQVGPPQFVPPASAPAFVATDPSAVETRQAAGAAPDPAPTVAPPPARQSPITFASSGGRMPQASTLDEATELLRQTEDMYLNALTRYAELASQTETGDPIARLAALQSIVMTTQAALNQAPTDAVINGYHLTALAQRDATLRQVAAVTGERWY
jgi:hypothetical protein